MARLRPTGAAICLSLAFCGAGRAAAQGVAGAAIQGTVSSADSTAVQDATVLVTNASTGERWQTTATGNGRYFVEHLSVGGPYSVEVRAIGFAPARRDGIVLSLGERHAVGFSLRRAAVELAEVTVRGAVDPLINAGRTGPAQLITDSTILRLPSARDYTSVALLAPQVNPGNSAISFGGQPDRLNGFQVDGTSNNDLFNSTATGNGTVAGFPDDRTAPTPESIAEVEVVSAPFDVRYGNFAGGMVNAVTKSGTNHLAGVAYGYFESQGLSGQQIAGGRPPDFGQGESGASLSGPIVRDRLAFFVDGSFRRRNDAQAVPDPTGGADSVAAGIGLGSATRFRDILANVYGVDPGEIAGRDYHTPSGSLFAKLTAQLGVNSRLDLSHDYFRGTFDFAGTHDHGLLQFTSKAGRVPVTVNATRLNWSTAFGRSWTNELLLARVHESNACTPASTFASVSVQAGADGSTIEAGSAPGCAGAKDAESSWELTDNLGLVRGPHRWTFGMHHELLRLQSATAAPDGGAWFFDGLDSLEQGVASRYERILPGLLAPDGPRADFPVRQVGFYLQDQWAPTGRLTVTAGMRLDAPFLPVTPPQNPDLLGRLGINTAITPSGHALWSPRLGLSYDLSGRGTTFLRSGVGLFAGRPAYIWFREAYLNTGAQQLLLICQGNDVPAFTLDADRQPTHCADLEEAAPVIAYFSPDFRFPRSLKLTIGGDQRLPGGVVGTVDFLYSRGVSQFVERDANLLPPTGRAAGEGGRALYGTIDPATGLTQPNRRDSSFGPVIEMFSRSGDRAWSLAFQLQKQFAGGTELGAAYTYTDGRDRQSTPADGAFDNLSASALDGTWEHPNLRSSIYSRPHKVALTGTFDLPLKVRLGLSYFAFSGDPLTYVVLGDANGDGIFNDPVYLPKSASDITLADPAEYAALDSLIEAQPCLQRQRGRLMERNSCRQPWFSELDARLTKVLPAVRGQSLELSVDCFNLLNLLDRGWGLARSISGDDGGFGQMRLLELEQYDDAHGRGVYHVLQPSLRQIDQAQSRWRLRLSARYTF
jgi:outer membrane receptor protein involved in Fe transport